MKNPRDQRPGAMGELSRLRWGVAANAGRLSSRRTWRWSHVRSATGLGSTKAQELCIAAGFDPDELVGGDDQQQPSPTAGPCPKCADIDLATIQADAHGMGQESAIKEVVRIVRDSADKLAAWMRTFEVNTNRRRELSFRAGERYEVAREIEAKFSYAFAEAAPPPSTGEPVGRPTIAELEAILNDPREHRIEFQPNGEIRAVVIEPAAPTGEPAGVREEGRREGLTAALGAVFNVATYGETSAQERSPHAVRSDIADAIQALLPAVPTGELVRREDVVEQVARWLERRYDWRRRGDDSDAYVACIPVAVSMLRNGSWLRDLAALDSPAPDAGQATKETP